MDDELFSNECGSSNFTNFLNLLGERVQLKVTIIMTPVDRNKKIPIILTSVGRNTKNTNNFSQGWQKYKPKYQ